MKERIEESAYSSQRVFAYGICRDERTDRQDGGDLPLSWLRAAGLTAFDHGSHHPAGYDREGCCYAKTDTRMLFYSACTAALLAVLWRCQRQVQWRQLPGQRWRTTHSCWTSSSLSSFKHRHSSWQIKPASSSLQNHHLHRRAGGAPVPRTSMSWQAEGQPKKLILLGIDMGGREVAVATP